MRKWEYLTVTARRPRTTKPRIWKVKGPDMKSERGLVFSYTAGPPVSDFLNRLGEHGWEMVSAWCVHGDGLSFPEIYEYILKRPKE
jgi:hypothetical protein